MTGKRMRSGNTHHRNGKVVSVRAHLWSPFTKMKKLMSGERSPTEAQRAALVAMQDPEPVEGFIPSRRTARLFDLGEPVPSKPACLNTEIGAVVFSADMVGTLNDLPSPLSKAEATALLVDAADRYARLTAFVAAEQGITCAELVDAENQAYPHPVDVAAAVGRHTSEDEAVRIVCALDGTAEEDLGVIFRAAQGYHRYMARNSKELFPALGRRHKEYNIISAESIVAGDDPEESYGGLYSLRQRSFLYGPTGQKVTPVKDILSRISEKTLAEFDDPASRHPGQPLVERYPSGVKIHLTSERSIEIVRRFGVSFDLSRESGEWYQQIRRVITENGKRRVVATLEFHNADSEGQGVSELEALFLTATNFRTPLMP